MTTDETLIALGRLTLHFAALDEMVTGFTAFLSGSEERSQSEAEIAGWPLGRKLKEMKRRAQRRAATYGLQEAETVTSLLRFIEDAGAAADERNKIVHSYVQLDASRKEHVFLHKKSGTERPVSREAIEQLAGRLGVLAFECPILVKQLANAVHSAESRKD